VSRQRVTALVRKELQDYRRNRYILFTMTMIPIIFLLQPLIYLLGLPAAASIPLSHRHELLYLMAIPVLTPAFMAASSVVMERQQGTLEPVLTTPVTREEFVLAKALAPLLPAVAASYLVYGLFVVIIEVFANPGVAPALLQWSGILAQVLFTPFLALWSIWVGIAVSTRMSDVRAAQQLAVLANLPLVILTSLIAFNAIAPTEGLVLGLAAALLVVDRLGWWFVSALFDRERLITGSRSMQ
jgi:ABC-2 type transport system permease protein